MNEKIPKLGYKSRSLLEELNSYVPTKNKEQIIETRAQHVISSAINVINLIEETYSPEEAEILVKRLLGSIKLQDPDKFSRVIKKIQENKDGK